MDRTNSKIKTDALAFVFCVFVALAFLAICSQSSFLYPFNTWVDPNCYMTVGKGIAHGMVPYRDFFEQKGPFLYFVHALGYIISPKSFLGVYFIESICVGTFLFFAHKIITLYYSSKFSYLSIPFLVLFAVTTRSFSQGDSSEEIMLPFVTTGLYFLIKYFKEFYPEKKEIPKTYLIVGGILAGCILWTKYTAIGFWFAWMMMVFFASIINKSYKRAFINCGLFLLGMFIATTPWLIYFGIHGALYELFDAYFYTNLFLYTQPMTFAERFGYAYSTLISNISDNKIITTLLIVGLASFLFYKKFIPNIFGRISILVTFAFTVLGVYFKGSGVYPYYFYLLVALSPLAFVAFSGVLKIIISKVKDKEAFILMNKFSMLFVLGITVLNLMTAFQTSANSYLIGTEKESLAQYHFAEIINTTENPTLLNYGFLDGGFYFAADTMPTTKYFCKLNLPNNLYPDLLDEHHRMISEREIDYIVTIKSGYLEDIGAYKLIEENYELVSQISQSYEFENYRITYLLYRLK